MPGVGGEPHTPDELAGLTPEQAEQLRAEWSRELARVEDEIATLRTVLQSKASLSLPTILLIHKTLAKFTIWSGGGC